MNNDYMALAILETFPVACLVINESHQVSHWNRACEALTGIGRSKMLGTSNHWQAFYPSHRMLMADLMLLGADAAQVDELYHGKFRPSPTIPGTFEAEDFFPNLGNGGRWLYFTAAPLRDKNGAVVGAIETLQDISERREAEEALKASEAQFKALSRTDSLTGLFNYRHFHQQIRQEIERAERYGRTLSLMFIDVDSFKGINDQYGHQAGDQVLGYLGNLIGRWKRSADTAFRYGGDEFVVVMPEIDEQQALVSAQRLLEQVAERRSLENGPHDLPTFTLSIGVSQYRPGEKSTCWIERADAAAYRAKRSGRSRAVRWDKTGTSSMQTP